ncbi:restriction endonuclease subunit S [Vibrio intestinalis]|uniref:restriction endonuclease subunit S n=1 Tax=Vibrio intestinalis TaxID=2933291 RepID=UPI0021A8E42E|nr:restriction endonuclease subunit S [Vibrio intestinalis]
MVPNGWKLLTLDELKSDKLSYGANSPSCELKENDTRYIRITDIDDSGNLNASAVGIDSDDYEDYVLKNNDFLFARSGNTVGKTFLYEEDKHPKAAYAGYLIRFRANQDKLISQYLKQFCFSSRYHFWVKSQLRAGAQPNINAKEYGGLQLPLPPLPEQRKIAKILSTWDKAITTTEKLIETSKQQKKALMQQLLTGKKRLVNPETGKVFEGDWKKVELGKLLDYKQPTPYLVKSTEYSNEYPTPVLTAGKTFILGYSNEDFGIFREELPAIIFDDFTTASKFVDFPFKAKSSAMKILIAKDGVSIKYVYEAMQVLNYPVGGHQRHWISIFANLVIGLPEPEEQQKIASVLTAADKEIEILEAKLTHFKQEKKALMQQLLTGKRRVKVDEEVAA